MKRPKGKPKKLVMPKLVLYETKVVIPPHPALGFMRGDTGKVHLSVNGLMHAAYSDHRDKKNRTNPWSMRVFAAIAAMYFHAFQSDNHIIDQGTCRPHCPGCRDEEAAMTNFYLWKLVMAKAEMEAAQREKDGDTWA